MALPGLGGSPEFGNTGMMGIPREEISDGENKEKASQTSVSQFCSVATR